VKAGAETRIWVTAWKRAGPALQAIKRTELRRLKTAAAIAQLEDHFAYALRTAKPTKTSGLVEQQRLFKKLRHG
jgi:hypothetical protein